MTKEEALSLRRGDHVLVCESNKYEMPSSIKKFVGQIVTVIEVDLYGNGDEALIVFEEGDAAVYNSEICFVNPPCIDEQLDESVIGDIFELFSGGVQ